MKQTRRKELKTNELSQQLQQLYAWAERNSTFLLAGVLAIVAILVIGMLAKQRMHNKEAAGWTSYYELRDKDVTAERDSLDRVRQLAAEWKTDSKLGPSVLRLKGTMEARLAMSLADPKDKDQKIQLLNDAVATYQELLDRYGEQGETAAESHMSLAGLEESLVLLGQGNIEKVRQQYQALASGKSVYSDIASARLGQLEHRLRSMEIVATRPAATSPAMTAMPQPTSTTGPAGESRAVSTSPAFTLSSSAPLATQPANSSPASQ